MCRMFVVAALIGGWLWWGGAAWAEPPSTSYIFPAGGQRGTRVSVRVGGHYLHDRCAFEMLGEGVTAPSQIERMETIWFEGPLVRLPASQRAEDYPKDYAAQIAIAADAAPGVRYWRAANAQGATAARKFIVGELPEVVEQEVEGEAIPASVTLPVTINGRVFPREDVDEWSFTAPRGRTITCVVAAAGLGSPLEARMEVLDALNRPVAEATGVGGGDPSLSFVVLDERPYRVRIHDVRGEGLQSFVYRLTVTDGPWVQHVYPLGGQRGATSTWTAEGANLANTTFTAALPRAGSDERVELQWEAAGSKTNWVPVAVDALPELLEQEPNNAIREANAAKASVVLNGRIDAPGDQDLWSVELSKGVEYVLEAQAGRWGSPLDSVVAVLKEDGSEAARADQGPNGSSDAVLRFTPPADGPYVIRVTDQFRSRGGRQFAYRLRVSPAAPRVRLEVASDVVAVERGKSLKLLVQVLREGGYAEPVALSVEGLPAGVTAAATTAAANVNKVELTIEASEQARVGASAIRIVGRPASVGPTAPATEAPLYAATPSVNGEPGLNQLALAVTLATPFKFQGAYEMTYISCGAVSRKRYVVERNGFEGPLEVRLADRQARHLQGVTGPTIIVPAGATEFVYPITLPPWMELGRTSRVVLMATGELDDGQGSRRKVSFSSGDQNNQMVNLVSPSPLRILLDRGTAAVEAGKETRIKVQVRRDRDLKSPVRLELVGPPHLQDVSATPVEVASESDIGELVVVYGSRPGPFTMPVVIRATARRGDDPLVAEATLELVPLK